MDIIWTDRKRHLGLPLSFTKYTLSEDRIFCQTGFLNQKEEEVLLYRVRDISLTRTLWQRITGVGTVCIISSDKTAPHLDLKNVHAPRDVKEMIFECVEDAKNARRMRTTELLDDGDGFHGDDLDGDDFDHQ